mmetsp:Transcript_34952/g.71463  ORF Transcript_34952/g.71463 Transcript_34952/m.71463 type:complete len:234 (+) Transcript_34952:273-974(+)
MNLLQKGVIVNSLVTEYVLPSGCCCLSQDCTIFLSCSVCYPFLGTLLHSGVGLFFSGIRIFYSKCIERIPGIGLVHTKPHPLRHNFLFTLNHRTATMLCETRVHLHGLWVNIAEECCTALFGDNMQPRVSEVGGSAPCWNSAINDNCGHAISWLELLAGAVTITMRHVPIWFFIVITSTSVLDRHKVLLTILVNVKAKNMVDISVYLATHSRNAIAFSLFVPWNLDTSLHCFA